jgi:mono/diheme cytochrome c family protein
VSRLPSLIFAAALALALSACSGEKLSPEAERGRQIYLSSCIACHSADPTQAGPVGPEIKGSSQELLEAKLLRGTYPPGYKPKRPTAVMPPQPQFAGDIPALAAYLR